MVFALLIARLGLSVVFLVAGVAKLSDLAGSQQALRDFGVPARLSTPFGVLLPLCELTVAVALLLPSLAWWGSLGPCCCWCSLWRALARPWPRDDSPTATVSANCTRGPQAGPP